MTDGSTPKDSGQTTTATAADPATGTAIGLITDGAYALIVARFPTMADAEGAYNTLTEIERTTSLRIDGVIVASSDAEGKVHLGKVTDHSTKTGLKWGVIGGVALGIVFPPSILASAVGLGALGAGAGKVRNVAHRSGLADELEGVMKPNTAGVIALVEDTAVVEIEKALAEADEIVTKAVDKQTALEIDREAAAAKASMGA